MIVAPGGSGIVTSSNVWPESMPSAIPETLTRSTVPSGWMSLGSGWPALAHRASSLTGSQATYAIVMNLPSAISSATTSFACARKSAGSGCSRASERNVNRAIAMSAVASIPCPVTSPTATASRPSGSSRKS